MCNLQTKTSNFDHLEGNLMPNMADPLKFDQIYLHFKHILGYLNQSPIAQTRPQSGCEAALSRRTRDNLVGLTF